MAAPVHQVVQVAYQNPDATEPLHIPIMVVCNTPDGVLAEHVRINTARRELEWLQQQPENDLPAIMVGGGASAADFVSEIKALQAIGAKVFAMNAASQWLRTQGIEADYQCILDAKEETACLVDTAGPVNIIASQVHPATMEAAMAPVVWHLQSNEGNIEIHFPSERIEKGGYSLLAGGASVGNSAMAVAYALGHREFHVFGYDCSFRDNEGHAYKQGMNDLIPTMEMGWGGKTYKLGVNMKGQLMAFQVMAGELKRSGCTIEVYGDGLLQHIYRTKPEDMTERDKYRAMWNFEDYREMSPGMICAGQFLEMVKPDGLILDFGCGTGRASVAMNTAGHKVFLIDFADNCRDQEALELPFLEWDLTQEIPMNAPYGFCADVLEHIPPEDVETVVQNIMASAETVFFQISTMPDAFGQLIGQPLHLTVRPFDWWRDKFTEMGHSVTWSDHDAIACQMVVERGTEREAK